MIIVNRLSKTLCVLLPVLICSLTISVNAQNSNNSSSVQRDTIAVDDTINQPSSSNTVTSDSVINETPSRLQLWSQLEEDKLYPLLCVSLLAILTFVVYLWQSFFGVPDWLVTTQEVKEKNEEMTECVEEHNVETHQGIVDDVAIELAVQVWRLEKRVGQLDLNDSPKLLRKMTDSVDKFKQLLHDNKVIVDDPVNRKYVAGWLEVKAIAWEEVPLEKCPDNIVADPFVLETIRPIVRRDGRPISIGQIIVAECEGEK